MVFRPRAMAHWAAFGLQTPAAIGRPVEVGRIVYSTRLEGERSSGEELTARGKTGTLK